MHAPDGTCATKHRRNARNTARTRFRTKGPPASPAQQHRPFPEYASESPGAPWYAVFGTRPLFRARLLRNGPLPSASIPRSDCCRHFPATGAPTYLHAFSPQASQALPRRQSSRKPMPLWSPLPSKPSATSPHRQTILLVTPLSPASASPAISPPPAFPQQQRARQGPWRFRKTD